MRSLVVFLAVVAAACGGFVPAQPAHHPAIVLDAHARPLDTAEVIHARAVHLQAKALEHSAPYHYAPLVHAPLVAAHAVHPVATSYVGGHAVTHQSRVDVHSSPAVLAPHWLHKRSLGHLAYAAPVVAHVAPAAVSHQSRVDVHSSPAVVAHAVHAPVVAHAVHAPVVAHVAPAAVSHQSRVDVRTSHPVVSHAVVAAPAPVYAAHSALSAWPAYSHGLGYGHGYGHELAHLLKKRSLALAHVVPAAVSHQSRVDVISSHAAPVAVAHAAPVAVVSHVTPLAHSAVWTAPAAHWAHSPLAFAAHW